MSNLNLKQTDKQEVKKDFEKKTESTQLALKPAVSASEISKSWVSFQSQVPLSYLVAARKAAREKNA